MWLKEKGARHPVWGTTILMLALALIFMGRALFPPAGQALGGHDVDAYHYGLHEALHTAVTSGRLPLWNSHHFSGYPLFADPQIGVFYPPAYLAVLLPVNVGLSWYMLLHIWLAGVGMFLFVRYMGGRWLGATLAGLTFAFSGFLAGRLWAGHITVYATNAWMPWILLGLAWSVTRRSVWTAVIAGLPLGLSMLAGHLPSMLYVGLTWIAFALFLFWRKWREGGQRLVVVQTAVAAVTAVSLAAVQLAPFIQFALASSRVAHASYPFATTYSLPPAHLITLVVPEYFGEPLRAGYWSVPTFEELTYYAGILPLLALALAWRKPPPLVWFYGLLALLGLLLALGSYGFLYRLFYDFLPPFRLVDAPARAAFLYLVAASALLGHVVSAWERDPGGEALARMMRRTLVVVGVAGMAALAAGGAVWATQPSAGTSGRLWQQMGGWAWALVVFLAGGLLLWRYLITKPAQRKQRAALAATLVALVVADLWLFSFKMVRLQPVPPAPLWQNAREVIGDTVARTLPWGVAPSSQNDAGRVGLYATSGYAAMELDRYRAFVATVPDPRSSAYDVLGAAYVVSPVPLDDFEEGERPLQLIEQRGPAWVYRRSRVLPVARLVYRMEVIANAEQAIARVHEPDFDPATTAILAAPPDCEVGPAQAEGDPAATAEIVAHEDGYWRIKTSSTAPGLLLLGETAYPGWRVAVDGETAVAHTAYTTLRAVCVPAGAHDVEWIFAPTIHWWGVPFTLAALVLIGVAWRKTRRKEDER